MKVLLFNHEQPAFNLAFEEWYFRSFEEETLRLWISGPSVIVGKHQNAFAESNPIYCRDMDVPVIRRISGGGTVYHDHGNLNFSFFRFSQDGKPLDYRKNLEVIVRALSKTGIDVSVNERNDLFFQGKKISGNAQHVSRGRCLHHGTLLFDTDLETLSRCIKRESGHFTDKAVKSVRSPVINLKPFSNAASTIEFRDNLVSELGLPQANIKVDEDAIAQLIRDRYQNDTWNFGYGPAYTFENSTGKLRVLLRVQRGGLIESAICEDELGTHTLPITGQIHTISVLKKVMDAGALNHVSKDQLFRLFF